MAEARAHVPHGLWPGTNRDGGGTTTPAPSPPTCRRAAEYGLHLLWLLVVLLPICYFGEEMVARLGIATGKGDAAMIYERFGKWWGRFSLFDLLVVNFLTLITEFAAISMALRALGVSPYLSVPTGGFGFDTDGLGKVEAICAGSAWSSCFACST